MGVVLSHILATRRYRWAWDWTYIKQISIFGWPLLINSFLMFFVEQGDRFIIIRGFSMEALGVYSVAASLSIIPCMMLIKVAHSIMLPILSSAQNSMEEFNRRYYLSAQALALFAALFAGTMVIGSNLFISMILLR